MCDGDTVQISSTVLCCNDSSICVQYDGTSIGSEAVYNTSDDYCITTNVMRTCTANRTWDGQTPSASEGTLDQGIYGPKILVFKNKTVVFLQLLMRRCLSHSLHKCGWELDSFLVELCVQLQF